MIKEAIKKLINSQNKKLFVLIAVLIYIVLFNIAYFKTQALYQLVSYKYGMIFKDVGFLKSLLFIGISLLPIIWIPFSIKRPSDLFLWSFYIITFIPICILSMYSSKLNFGNYLIKIITMAVSFFILHKTILFFKAYQIRLFKAFSEIYLKILIFLAVLSLIFLIIRLYSIMNCSLTFQDVYKQRAIFSNFVGHSRSFLKYLFGWLGTAVFPFFIIYGMYLKRWIIIVFGVIGQIILYSMAALKMTLFSIFFIPLLFFFFKYYADKINFVKFIYCIICGIFLLLLSYIVSNKAAVLQLFFVRIFITGNLTTIWHFEFFDKNPFTYLSYTFLNPFLNYPYTHDIAVEVCNFALHRHCSANACYMAGAYANFGLMGMLIYSLILGFFLSVFNSIAQHWPKYIAYTVITWTGFYFIATDLFTTLLSHGFLIWIILLYFFSQHSYHKELV